MKKIFFFLFVVSCSLNGQDVQKEINEQVWKPFIKNFNEHNTGEFMAVHSKDVTRSPRDSKSVWDWNEYSKGTSYWRPARPKRKKEAHVGASIYGAHQQ